MQGGIKLISFCLIFLIKSIIFVLFKSIKILMKKLIHIFVFIAITGIVSGQSIVLTDQSHNPLANDTMYVSGAVTDYLIDAYIDFKNNTTSNFSVVIHKYQLDLVSCNNNYMCVGPSCYPGVEIPPYAINAGVTDELHIQFFPNGTPGVSKIAYTFYVSGTPSDSVQTTVFFDITTGINEVSYLSNMKPFPNPASDITSFNFRPAPGDQIKVKVFNIIGNEVSSHILKQGESILQIPVSGMKEGVYFCSIYRNNKIEGTSRLIVTR